LDDAERRKAVHWTKNTIATAVQAGAQVVVVHAGTIELPEDPTRELLDLYRAGKERTPEFSQSRARLLELRRQNAGAYLQSVERSFKEILPYARDKNIKLGLETRYYPVEVPNHEEIGSLLDRFHHEGLFYWHDVGHAEVNARLGITPHEDYLKDYGDRLIGWHLHGVSVLRDHLAPFDGDFDLTSVFPFIKDGHIKVIESHTSARPEQIRKAVEQLSEVARR
jgi:sugar phosphate isomerase/epimerase